jgi:predicted transposase YdaD
MGVNTKHKDSLFSFLFSKPDVLRELYCALEGVTLSPDVPVTINTLQDVIFKDKVNDVSFEIDGKLVILLEHQSTINPNMALRLLLYITRVYEKIIKDQKIYSKRLVHIPRPEFFVLYNGVSPYPDEATLKLSDAFESAGSLKIAEKAPALELVVKVININQGKNVGIAGKCKMLAEYSAFIGKVRKYENEGHGIDEAMKMAIKDCRENNILKEILDANASEVFNMLITEWNWDDALAVNREEGREEGREEEKKEIARNALSKGYLPEQVCAITGLDMETIKSLCDTLR